METGLQPIARDTSQNKTIFILFAIIIISGSSVSYFMYSVDKYALTYYGDAVSHLVAARKLFDWSENPGWGQLGTVWLPLPHFLLMFPSYIDGLFFTGFAGLAVSLPSLALTSVLIYKTLMRTLIRIPNIEHRTVTIAAFSAALLYGVNPNFLYLGITAMTEAPFMLFLVACAYFFLRWYEENESHSSGKGTKHLVLSAAFASAATLCRYEGWILPLFLISIPIIMAVVKAMRESSKGSDIPAQRLAGKSSTTYTTIVFTVLASVLSLSGMIFWLAYNAITYGDPLEFANAQYYSAASQALSRSTRENLYLQPLNVLTVYGVTGLLTYGPVILVASVIGYLVHRRSREFRRSMTFTLVLLALPPIFTITSLLIGIGEMAYWFNSRFLILTAPLLMLLIGFYIVKQPARIASSRRLLIGVIAGLFAFLLVILPFNAVVTLADAKGGFMYKHAPFAVMAGEKIGSLYEGSGSIMIITGSAQEHRILLASGIGFRHFDSIIESSTWKSSFYEPWVHSDTWIIISKDPDSDGVSVVKYWNDHEGSLNQFYVRVYENTYYEIFKLKN